MRSQTQTKDSQEVTKMEINSDSPQDETDSLSLSLGFYKLTERVPGVRAGQEQQRLAGKR